MNWRNEVGRVTADFYQTQKNLYLRQLFLGSQKNWTWPDRWIPYFGGDPAKDVLGNPNWRNNLVTPPYTLMFISTGKWWVDFESFGTDWMASFVSDTSTGKVDIRGMVSYAEDKHKDDKAVPTKKWKYL